MRVTSDFWVAAYIRRCHTAGAYAVVRRRGSEESGAIFVVIDRLNGSRTLFEPAPQSAIDGTREDRMFIPVEGLGDGVDVLEARLTREIRYDPDLWIVEVEDRNGRHFLDLAR